MSKSTRIIVVVLSVTIVVLLATVASLVGGFGVGQNTPVTTSSPSMVPSPNNQLSGGAPGVQDSATASKGVLTDRGTSAVTGGMLAPASTGDVAVGATTRLIVRNQSFRLRVKKVQPAIDRISELAKRYSGLITDAQIASDTGGIIRPLAAGEASFANGEIPLSGWVTVRIPVAKVDAFVSEARKLGTVQAQTQSADDVTQQHIDLVARLANLTAHERQLRTFFARAKTVNEMLSVENELSRVRGEIESLTAEKDYLERQAALATVTFELVEPAAVVRPAGYDWGIGSAVTTGVRALVATVNAIIIVTLGALPLLLIAGLLFLFIRVLIRRQAARRAAQPAAAASGAAVSDEDEREGDAGQ